MVPVFFGLITIPKIIELIGLERFGILTLVWAMVGYFSFFDFGLSRVMTIKVAGFRDKMDAPEIQSIFWSIQRIILVFSVFGSIVLLVLSSMPELMKAVTAHVSDELVDEGILSMRVIAFTLPAITATAGAKGLLEADFRFKELNLLQVQMGALNFILPLAIALASPNLAGLVLGLCLLRLVYLWQHLRLCLRFFPQIKSIKLVSLSESIVFLKAGGWLSVSNVVGPIMNYFDRFFLATAVPAASLAFYTTPSEITNRLMVIPASLSRALFPAFVRHEQGAGSSRLLMRGTLILAVVMFVIIVSGVLFGRWALSVWIDPNFAEKSYPIFVILLIGFGINAIAWLPFAMIQGVGRSDLTAKSHLLELPVYLIALYFAVHRYGLIGAASVWSLRCLLDTIILWLIARRFLGAKGRIV